MNETVKKAYEIAKETGDFEVDYLPDFQRLYLQWLPAYHFPFISTQFLLFSQVCPMDSLSSL